MCKGALGILLYYKVYYTNKHCLIYSYKICRSTNLSFFDYNMLTKYACLNNLTTANLQKRSIENKEKVKC